MARLRRIEYYGAYYHVIQRGVNREDIFRDDGDKAKLLEIVMEAREEFDFKLFAYVIMDNHYHFLVQTLNIPISRIMHYINMRYALAYNRKHQRLGHVFENRYKSILVQDNSYFITLIKYIHKNPVAAGMATSMEEYRWTSDIFYRRNMDSLVDIDEFLDLLARERPQAIREYIRLMDEKDKIDREVLMKTYEKTSIIGSRDFVKSILSDGEEGESLDEILMKACPSREEYQLIKSGSRLRYLTDYKKDYIEMAREKGYTVAEIGGNIGVSGQAVQNLVKK